MNTTYFRSCDNHSVGTLAGVEGGYGAGVGKVQLATGAEEQLDPGTIGETAHQGGSDHALVSGDMDFHVRGMRSEP